MACNSCGTGKDGAPSGCRSNGTCGTGSCNKLNVYNWLNDMTLPHGQSPYPIVEVRFKGSRKEFFHNKENVELKVGDVVAVEASPGHDVGVVAMVGELVRFQLKKKNVAENSDLIKSLYRKAKSSEVEKWNEVKDRETSTLHRTREIIQSLKLSMKLSDIEFQGDGKKATFFYTADDRVDFRELIKKLAEEFKIRVEMRQIGMRQEASRLGGIGVCGRELCCSTWLTDFKTVSTSTARYQNLALNPAKLAGQCTKLKCCLNYELDSYMDALKDLPSTSVILETEKGRAFHRKTDIFKRLMWYAFSVDEKREQSELIEGGVAGNWVVLPIDRVNEIIELNKQKIKPTDLALPEDEEEEEYEPDYENVVGQDSIYRMDKPKKKKKKKKRPALTIASGETTTASVDAPNQNQPQQNRPQHQRPPQQSSGDRPQQTGDRPQQQRPPQQPSGDRPQQSRPPQQQGGGQQQNRPQQPRNPQQNQGKPQQQNPRPQQSRTNPTPRPENTESKSQEPPTAKPTTPSQPAAPQLPRNPNRPQRIPRPDSPTTDGEPKN